MGGGNGELPSGGAGPTAARWSPGELVALSPATTRVRAELLSPPRANCWVSDELFHSTSIIFPLRHGGDAARARRGAAAEGRTLWAAKGWLLQAQHCCAHRGLGSPWLTLLASSELRLFVSSLTVTES